MSCASCGADGPTQTVLLRQNLGVLFRRQVRRVEGALCGRCIHETALRMNTANLLGMLGLISLFVAPYFLIANFRQARRARALAPKLDGEERKRIRREAAIDAAGDMLAILGGERGRDGAERLKANLSSRRRLK